jgi:hypothetical protein
VVVTLVELGVSVDLLFEVEVETTIGDDVVETEAENERVSEGKALVRDMFG